MGIGSFFKQLVSRTSPLQSISDSDLNRLWQANQVLSSGLRMQLRDEFARRACPFPFAEASDPNRPLVPDLDDLLDLESLQTYLQRLDPKTRADEGIRPFRGGVVIEMEPGLFLGVAFRTWRGSTPSWPLTTQERLTAVLEMASEPTGFWKAWTGTHGQEVSTFHPDQLPANGVLGSLQIERLEHSSPVVEIINEDEQRILLGASVPLHHLHGPLSATWIVGGLEEPTALDPGQETADEEVAEPETTEQTFEWSPEQMLDFEQLALLQDVEGVDGRGTTVTGFVIRAQIAAYGEGVPVTCEAQVLLQGAFSEDWDALATVEPERDVFAEAMHALIVENYPHLRQFVDVAGSGLSPYEKAYREGIAAELSGQLESARAAYARAVEVASDEERMAHGQLAYLDPSSEGRLAWANQVAQTSELDPVLTANAALTLWHNGQQTEAINLLQTAHTPSGSWLGATLDATVHTEFREEAALSLYSVIGYRAAPVAAAAGFLRAGNATESERLLRRALALEPKHPAALGLLVQHLTAQNREEEALTLCTNILDEAPSYVFHRAIRAILLLRAEQFEQAVSDLKQCLESEPDHIEWRTNLIFGLKALGQLEQVRVQLQELGRQGGDMTLVKTLQEALG